ncbi:phosphotransferase family protein [Haloarcula marina]|uniref:phosphotransferase family protein n=1 Tax=Haloarcula marina TaxID=2961574 RepID=UPI0020B7E41B|nr:phosphotransferase [Halomicroarcula marina]
MTPAEAVLRRVLPERAPERIDRPRQGNHKETAVARYPDRPAVVVQLTDDPTAIHTEANLLSAIDHRTSVPVPHLLAHGELGDRGYLVTEYVGGVDLHAAFVDLPPTRREAIARRFGAILAELHAAFPFESAGPLSVDETGALVAAGRTPSEEFRASTDAALAALPSAFDSLRPALDSALRPPEETRPPRLFPWDLRPGNAVVADGRLAAVLDWGAPRAADPALSVAKAEHLVAHWYGVDAEPLVRAFRTGYASVRPLPEVPVAYRLAAVVSAAVDSTGTVTRPHYPERTGEDALAVHRDWLTRWLDAAESE